jgi:hypothetical protein
MDSSIFVRRLDLAKAYGATDYYWAKDFGSIVRRGRGLLSWWCSNDCRSGLIGVEPNSELVQPTLGPFETFDKAFKAYVAATRPSARLIGP